MDALDLVDDLRDRAGRPRRSPARAPPSRETPSSRSIRSSIVASRLLGGEVEVLVEAEREPGVGGPRDRRAQLDVAELEASASPARAGTRSPCPDTSPSPCAPWPSPAITSAPSTGIGRYSVVPATSSLQSMLPPQRRGGIVECSPGSGGGMPITPRNGAERTRAAAEPPRVAVERPSEAPRRRAHVRPQSPRDDLVDVRRRASARRARRAPRSGRRAHGRRLRDAPARRRRPTTSRRASVWKDDRLAGVDRPTGLVVAREPAPHAPRLLDPGVRRREQDAQADPPAVARRGTPGATTACSSPRSSGATSAGT